MTRRGAISWWRVAVGVTLVAACVGLADGTVLAITSVPEWAPNGIGLWAIVVVPATMFALGFFALGAAVGLNTVSYGLRGRTIPWLRMSYRRQSSR